MLVVVKIGDTASFVFKENGNLVITPHIQDADKFTDNDLCSQLLSESRAKFKEHKFVIANCPDVIFGDKPRHVR